MADIGITTQVGLRRDGARVPASGPTPGTPTTILGVYSRSQLTTPTADLRLSNVRFSGADYLLASPSPPTFGAFIPAAGALARTDPVSVIVSDPSGFDSILVWAVLADGTVEMVFDGTSFSAAFDAGSSISGSTSKTVTVQHDAPGSTHDFTLVVTATNALRRASSASAAYTLSDPPAAPAIGNFAPTSGATTTRTGTITIDVTDDEGRTAVALVTIAVALADGRVLTAYNGIDFPGPFAAGSARSNITNGYRYSLVHGGAGWPTSALAFRITAVDAQGRITTSTTYTLTVSDAQAGPTFGSFSPVAGAVARAAAVSFSVTDPDAFAAITVWAVLGDGSTVVVYDGASFGTLVDAGSSVGGTTTKSFVVAYDGAGWPDDYTLHVRAVDSLGASATTSSTYTLSDPPAPADPTAPEVELVSPAADSAITRSTPIVIDVTDASAFAAIFVWVVYLNGDEEVAHNGTTFAARYAHGSLRTDIAGGFRYTLRRAGGWPLAPTVRILPVDTFGNAP